MVETTGVRQPRFTPDRQPLRLVRFEVSGLLNGPDISINFPGDTDVENIPAVVILAGRNGTGKTTILRMIAGMLKLDFDDFRRTPFNEASLLLSSEQTLRVTRQNDENFPLLVQFGKSSASLARSRDFDYSAEQRSSVDAFREATLPVLSRIHYELLELDRTPRRERLTREERNILEAYGRVPTRVVQRPNLADRVKEFLREAQVDHRRYFRPDERHSLPMILRRLNLETEPPTTDELLDRIAQIYLQYGQLRRFGLQVDEVQLRTLRRILKSGTYSAPQQLAVIETYVEVQETAQQARNLLAERLTNFENIMADFLIGKTIRVDPQHGLTISVDDQILKEEQLSSGEYHFLYMMVAALLCRRTGSIIAIDEPELSLHISWQRKLINALASCASGAAPTFLFATHSLAIVSEYADRVCELSPLD